MPKPWDDRIAELKEMELRLRAAQEPDVDPSVAPEMPCVPPYPPPVPSSTGLYSSPDCSSRWESERSPVRRQPWTTPHTWRSVVRSLATGWTQSLRAVLRLGGWRDTADTDR